MIPAIAGACGVIAAGGMIGANAISSTAIKTDAVDLAVKASLRYTKTAAIIVSTVTTTSTKKAAGGIRRTRATIAVTVVGAGDASGAAIETAIISAAAATVVEKPTNAATTIVITTDRIGRTRGTPTVAIVLAHKAADTTDESGFAGACATAVVVISAIATAEGVIPPRCMRRTRADAVVIADAHKTSRAAVKR
jgi:hypothetical protein